MSNTKKQLMMSAVEGLIKKYAEHIKKISRHVLVLENRVKALTCLHNEEDTGLDLDSFSPIMDTIITATHQHCLVAEICSSYVDSDNNIKYIVKLSNTPVQYVVQIQPDSFINPIMLKEGMRVGVDVRDQSILTIFPAEVEDFVKLVEVTERPEVTFDDIGGYKDQIQSLKEIFLGTLRQTQACNRLRIEPPRGALLYGPPGTGKTLCAKAVANASGATFMRIVSTELVKKNLGEGPRLVREIFKFARTKEPCIIFIDEIDAIGSSRMSSSSQGESTEVQRIMMELINQLDGFDPRGNIRVIMATNRPETLDPALLRPGRLDRMIEFGPPGHEDLVDIIKIQIRRMPLDQDIRLELIARKAVNLVAAEIRCICTEAGIMALRQERKTVSEKDLMEAIDKINAKKLNAINLTTGSYN